MLRAAASSPPVIPDKDLVVVIRAHLSATVDATAVTRWLLEKYILPAAG